MPIITFYFKMISASNEKLTFSNILESINQSSPKKYITWNIFLFPINHFIIRVTNKVKCHGY